MEKNKFIEYENCSLCPRNCKVNRNQNYTGVCGVTSQLQLARAALHFWEEPCISGTRGSGAVFFTGCPLGCVYCQNREIASGRVGKPIHSGRLAEIFLELQEKGANNINLVTAVMYVPQVIAAVEDARRQGLYIPVLYNNGGYETVETIKRLEGIVDIYLPDYKYHESKYAAKYSKAKDYPQVAMAAIREMVRQQPNTYFATEGTEAEDATNFSTEYNRGSVVVKGVIIRQLLLPGLLYDARQGLHDLFLEFHNDVYYSLMSQYTPLAHVQAYPELNARVTQEAYDNFTHYASQLGIEHGFVQEREVATESFIPHFDYEGV